MIHVATVSSRGQVTIPVKLRRDLELQAGDQVAFLKTNHQAIMQPIEQKTEADIVQLFGSVDPQEKSADPTVATRKDFY